MKLPILKRNVANAPAVEPCFNVMSMFDVLTGYYVKGVHGEMILTGGLPPFLAFSGDGNTFKSTIMYTLNLIAFKRYLSSSMEVYDAENNLTFSRISNLAKLSAKIEDENNIEGNERFTLVKSYQMPGEKWWESWKSFSREKAKNKDAKLLTPFIGHDGKPMEVFLPTLGVLDSLSGWTASNILDKLEDAEIGDAKNNTLFARDNLLKTQLLMDIKDTVPESNCFISTVTHISNKMSMDGKPVSKDMQHLPQGKKFGGVPKKFEYYTTVTWLVLKVNTLQDSNKQPQYPRNSEDDLRGDTDLNEVILSTIRNKLGPSGTGIKVVCSQEGGLHVSLSEFHFCKENNFGISGNVRSYSMDLYPDVTLMRTTVRGKLDDDPLLRRAVEITAELCTMNMYWHDNPMWTQYKCTPKELYEDLKSLGYDWNVLLNTRGYWLFDVEAEHDPLPYLSTMDLLRMRKGDYKPFWMK